MDRATDQDEFLRFVTRYQGQLYAYLYALLHNMPDSEDVLQNTIVVLWKKFDQFEPDSNFLHWAMRTAHYEALRFQRTMRRDRRFFSEALVTRLTEGPFGEVREDLSLCRTQALSGCMQKLTDRDRSLLQVCYHTGATISAIALERGRSVQSVCNSLRRIRQSLFECIERTLAKGEELQ
jgi:RNA polymerase sigma-70 factor (ECF subfamily)